jgi:hypothetical protein
MLIGALFLSACGGGNGVDSNDPKPVAHAGAEQTVNERTAVTLDGSNSRDDSEIVDYSWSQISGPTVVINNNDQVIANFQAPEVTSTTALRFRLTVTDDNGSTGSDEVDIFVDHVNRPPSANAGSDFETPEEALTQLDGGASSDPDAGDSIASYSWVQTDGTTVTINNADVANASFTAPSVTADELLTFELTVTDTEGASATDSVTVTIKQINKPPIANAGDDALANEGTLVNLDGSDSEDPDGSIASYAWSQQSGPMAAISNADQAGASFTAPEVTETTELVFILTVTDNEGATDSDTVSIYVHHVNKAPSANAGDDREENEETNVSLDGSASSDADGTIESYQWQQVGGPPVSINNADSINADFDAPSVTTDTIVSFSLEVTDNDGASDTDIISITIKQVNKAPLADAGADKDVDENTATSLDGSASSDPDGSIASYSWEQIGGPDVLNISGADSDTVSFTTPDVSSDTEVVFQLTVTDNEGLSSTDTVTVTVLFVPQPPIANAGTDQTVEPATNVQLDGSNSSDPDGSITTYAWTQTDGPMVILTGADTDSASFTSPTVAAETDLIFELEVTDDDALTDTDSVTITVLPPNVDPVANAGPDQTVDEGDTVQLDGSASSDSDGSITQYQWTQLSGPTVTLINADQVNASFIADSVAPTGASVTLQLEVTDDRSGTSTDTVTVDIGNVNEAPIAYAGVNQSIDYNEFGATLDGTGSSDPDGNNADLTYSWTSLSPDLFIGDPSSPTPTVFPFPFGAGGTALVQLVVTDSEGTASAADIVQLRLHGNTGFGGGVTINGTVTYDHVPHTAATSGLDYDATAAEPVKHAHVFISAPSIGLFDTTDTDANGNYSYSVPDPGVPFDVDIIVFAAALDSPGAVDVSASNWVAGVSDNINGNTIYALEASTTAIGNTTIDLHAESGWDPIANDYTGPRTAAPFAISQSLLEAYQTAAAADPNITFPELTAYWHPDNTDACSGNTSIGCLGSAFYSNDEIYLRGDADVNTDEYDGHVVLHEWGHFYEDNISRSDSTGGPHIIGEKIDMRLAMGEGFASAFAGIATGDPVLHESLGFAQSSGFSINVEDNDTAGWYNETSVAGLIYDIADDDADGSGDTLALGWVHLHRSLSSGDYVNQASLTSIFSLLDELTVLQPKHLNSVAALAALRGTNSINAFGDGESNDGGDSDNLPVYADMVPITAAEATLCTNNDLGTFNKLGNRRFVELTIPSDGDYRFTTAPAGAEFGDTDMALYLDGAPEHFFVAIGDEDDTLNLIADTYVIELLDFCLFVPSDSFCTDGGATGDYCTTLTIEQQ